MKIFLALILLITISLYMCDAKSSVVNIDEQNWKIILENEWLVEL